MTDKLPRVTAAEAIRVLERTGFFLARQSGSHKIYKNKEGKRVTIPYHPGKVRYDINEEYVKLAERRIKQFLLEFKSPKLGYV